MPGAGLLLAVALATAPVAQELQADSTAAADAEDVTSAAPLAAPVVEDDPPPAQPNPAARKSSGTGPALIDPSQPYRVVDEVAPGPSLPGKGDLVN